MEASLAQQIIITQTPTLQCENKSGGTQFWEAYGIKKPDGSCFYYSVTWRTLEGGGTSARTASTPSRVTGKNLGRSNETSDEEQTIFEVSVLERKKREEGYHEEGEESTLELLLPMLAHTYFDTITFDKKTGKEKVKKGHKPKIKFPCYAQPKLDGFRCIMDTTKGIAWSRNGKLWKPEVVAHLMFDGNGAILDGELMLPAGMDFELLKTATSNFVPGLTDKMGYHVYDCLPDGANISPEHSYKQRYRFLKEMFKQAEDVGELPENVYLVKCSKCPDADYAENELLPRALELGYEGLMLRNMDASYLIKHRSYDLQKLKLWQEDEFEIVDCCDGRGTDEEAIMYVCVNKDGREFNVRPKGSIPSRRALWEDWVNEKIDPRGKMLTVEYFMLTKRGVPRFPKGKAIRDYE